MKKLKFNSTLNHKQSDYKTREIIVEKVITLYGNHFSELRDHPLRDDLYIAENCDLMYIDSNDTAHCLLMVDYDSGDGILVESEGMSYARKSQFIVEKFHRRVSSIITLFCRGTEKTVWMNRICKRRWKIRFRWIWQRKNLMRILIWKILRISILTMIFKWNYKKEILQYEVQRIFCEDYAG